ncbi:Protein-tyrosine-phosphatase IBR5 [Morella rubra]|uniref:Protein-tyrosine-phosphatase IBR5 n=1 Tax=Morella rubra TaxID=262757 RepID=A0A6A1V8J4_9ROSI|nr:Protein-tyrosine-phosphatase IBR5 [Morella rubra]
MRKRERENPCGVCGHYHKYEEGEVCGICGHRIPATSEKTSIQVSAFPSEILPDFLYLGSYDNASRSELLKTQGISRVLNGLEYVIRSLSTVFCDIDNVKLQERLCINIIAGRQFYTHTVPACQNLYKNSFTYHCLQDDKTLPFDNAIQFLEQCERDKARVLVHCMSGKNRSPAIVIAYLMKSKGWRLAQSYQWVKERRPSVELSEAVYQQLQEYEQKIFGSISTGSPFPPVFAPTVVPSFSFGFPKINNPLLIPAFSNVGATSIFARPPLDFPSQEFTFGASQIQKNNDNTLNPNGSDIQMDGS